ncbi:MAG: nuclear transport factor 2 family protein [Gemmatimonadaceae bacterium]
MPNNRTATLALLMLLAGCRTPGTGAAEPSAISEIRALRARSNAAIAAKDVGGVVGIMVPDIIVVGGNGGAQLGRDSSEASFARQFADPNFLGYTRTPTRVELSDVRPLAAEAGEWMGQWREVDGIRQLRGTYLAMWRRTEGGWRLRSELFVTLSCTGSSACTQAR